MGGGIGCTGSSPLLIGCQFLDNTASEYGGGAVLLNENSSATIDNCFFSGNLATDSGGGVACYGSSPTIKNSTFIGSTAVNGGGGAVYSGFGAAPRVESCTIVGSSSDFGAGVMCYQDAFATIERSIIAFSVTGNAVACLNASSVSLSCSDLYGNPAGDWVGCIAGQLGVAGNFCDDPLFCNAGTGDLTLAEVSPCSPENSPGVCGLVGAQPVGCGTVSAEADAGADAAPAAGAPLRIYPNPITAGSVIEWASASSAGLVLHLYDPTGRLVLSHELGEHGTGRHTVHLADIPGIRSLPPAVYVADLRGMGGPHHTVRVILIR
jgi:hypothetical protein